MAKMLFVETSFKTRIATLINQEDRVYAFKDKFIKEHEMCFPEFGKITISASKVKWEDNFYCLSDSVILSKVFENENCERFVFVDVEGVKKKPDPTKKRKLKSSSSAHLLNESKDFENVLSSGDNQKNQDGLDDDHVKDLNADQTLEKDLEKEVTNASDAADIFMFDQETDLEKDDEKVDNGEETKVVKPKKKTKSSKEKVVPKEDTLVGSTSPNVVVALTAPNVQHGDGDTIVKKPSRRSKNKQSDERNVEEGPVVSAE